MTGLEVVMKLRTAAVVLALLASGGCGRSVSPVPNNPPEIQLFHVTELSPTGYIRHQLEWTGSDADGDLDHYVYAIDPSNVDRVDGRWIATQDTRMQLEFAARYAIDGTRIIDPHVFAIRAVDGEGAMSASASVAMSGHNIPPVVAITSPKPSAAAPLDVPPSFTVRFGGSDPDGVTTHTPARYAYRLFTSGEPGFSLALGDPDALMNLYAPDFDDWTHVPGSVTGTVLTDLEVGREYALALAGYDEQGDYDRVFSLNRNIFDFIVRPAETIGPVIRIYNETFSYTYRTGGYDEDPSRLILLSMFANVPLTLNWSTTSPAGVASTGTRWVLDPVDLHDETPRTGPDDLSHWSEWSTSVKSVTLGPYPGGEHHTWYLEGRDGLGLSLGGGDITVGLGVADRGW